MADVTVTVAEGKRVINRGKFVDAGDTFTVDESAVAALVAVGTVEKPKGK